MDSHVSEAPLRAVEGGGLAPDGDGWFIVNVADARAYSNERYGDRCRFEGSSRFSDFGLNVHVVRPGQPASLYHREEVQEAFLVLSGSCLAIVEEQERQLVAGDLLHAPAGTAHVLVGTGDTPCVILMIGGRKPLKDPFYPVSDLAAKYGASVEREVDSLAAAYAGSKSEPPTLGPIAPWAESADAATPMI